MTWAEWNEERERRREREETKVTILLFALKVLLDKTLAERLSFMNSVCFGGRMFFQEM